MLRYLFSSLVLVAACMNTPHESVPDVGNVPCVTCHMSDFQKANALDSTHTNQDCAQCHDTSSWNAGHPESKFPISTGAHVNIACKTCHSESGAYVAGANTNCIQCHPQTQTDPQHVGTSGYAYSNTTKNFCLTCHPDGKAAGHPEAQFPITSGNHSGIACADCHKASLGSSYASNYDCYSCHTTQHNNPNHDPKLCASSGCHPSGSTGN